MNNQGNMRTLQRKRCRDEWKQRVSICDQLGTHLNGLSNVLQPYQKPSPISETHAEKRSMIQFFGRFSASGMQNWGTVGFGFDYLFRQFVSSIRKSHVCDHRKLTRIHYWKNIPFAEHDWQSGSQIIDFESSRVLPKFFIFDQARRLCKKNRMNVRQDFNSGRQLSE